MQRKPRIELPLHLVFIRRLPCLVTGRSGVEAAHIRYGELSLCKPISGMQMKPHDYWVVPLSPEEHRKQHARGNERAYWKSVGIDPLLYALRLWSVTGDYEMGCQIVAAAKSAQCP